MRGQRVTFRRGSRELRPGKGIGYRVDAAAAAAAGTVLLVSPKGRKDDWSPARWGGDQAEAFDWVSIELRQGNRVQFIRRNRRADRNNGDIVTVRAIDPQGSNILVEKDDGSQQMLDLSRLADQHIRHGWVRTIHSAQAQPPIASWPSWRATRSGSPRCSPTRSSRPPP